MNATSETRSGDRPASPAGSVRVRFGAANGEYAYVETATAAATALDWAMDGAGGTACGPGAALGIDLETTALDPAEGRVRLVQIAAGARCVVMDAFAFDPWPLLAEVSAAGPVHWTAHHADFEQGWLAAHAGFTLLPMFDTRWVHVRLRAERTGVWQTRESSLAVVCADVLRLPLSKEQRLSDWRAPRLTPAQVEYAALDALVLIPLRLVLEASAGESNRQVELALAEAGEKALALAGPPARPAAA